MVESSCWFPPFVALEALRGEDGLGAALAGSGGLRGGLRSDVRWERVAVIRARLASGRYRVSAVAVAEAMMRGTESLRAETVVECELAMQ
jgi:hypothetical protein